MSDRPQEVRKRFVLANFRQPYARMDEPRRERARDRRAGMSPTHLARIRRLQCTFCYETEGIHAHHLQSGPARLERGVGLKATDRYSIPLCPLCHGDVHRYGSRRERDYSLRRGIDPHDLAAALWRRSSDREGDEEKSLDDMRDCLRRFKMAAIRELSHRARYGREEDRRP